MRRRLALLTVIPAAALAVACGRVTSVMPTGPSALATSSAPSATPAPALDFPSLAGRWRAVGDVVFRNLANGNTLSWGSCSGSFTITQDGGAFSGPFTAQGGGWNSDRFCTVAGTFSGELLGPDGSVARARLEGNFQNWPRPSVSPPCELLSRGDGIWTGRATGDDMHLQMSDVLRCPVNVDGGVPGLPMADFERTVSLTMRRW